MKKLAWFFPVLLLCAALPAQEFGFGFGGEDEPGPGNTPGVHVGGKVSAELMVFIDEFWSWERFKNISLGNFFSGALNFSAAGSNVSGVINLDIKPDLTSPAEILSAFTINEAYLSAYYGRFTVEAGLRKINWGRADSFGPLDVINPLDYTDLSAMSSPKEIKIARPLLSASFSIGNFTKVEAVVVPWFAGHAFAPEGRWMPAQATALYDKFAALGITSSLYPPIPAPASVADLPVIDLDTTTLSYAQGGVRFTTTLGPADFGLQYYYGLNPRPSYQLKADAYAVLATNLQAYYTAAGAGNTAAAAAAQTAIKNMLADRSSLIDLEYNRYHQIGVDYAQVLAGFNVRAELAANITGDLDGNDGLVYNPALLWSLGFDRMIPVTGITANVQVNESIRLFDSEVGSDPLFDIEAGKKITSTRVTASLSRAFFRDALELKALVIWGIEDGDCYIIPVITWTRGDASLEFSGGIFAGSDEGELGQYRKNNFIKTVLSYSF